MASTPDSAGSESIVPAESRDGTSDVPQYGRGHGMKPSWLARVSVVARSAPPERKFLWILLTLFIAKGVIFTFVFEPFSGHDEVAHYGYLQFIAEDGRPPVIPDKDEWQAEYAQTREQTIHDRIPVSVWSFCSRTTNDWYHGCSEARFANSPVYAINYDGETLPSGWVYTANHPPLYYLVMTPVYWLTSGGSVETQLYILRLAAIPFGLITVLFAYMTTRVIFPRDQFLTVVVPTFVAFQPQVSYEAAMLNNDIFAIAFTSVIFYFLALGLRQKFSWRICVMIGLFFGLAMLSKNTSAVSGLVIAIAMILGLGIRNWKAWLPRGAVAAGVGGLLIWPWYLYMWTTYGDFTGLDRIKELQYWNYQGGETPTIWTQLFDREFAWMRWRETWGEFGWRLIPLDESLLWILFWFCAIGLLGLIWWAVQSRLADTGRTITFRNDTGGWSPPAIASFAGDETRREIDPIFRLDRPARIAIVTLFLACIIAYYAILQFGLTFSLTQARYYFPSLNAATILIMLGYRAMLPRRWHVYTQALFFIAFAALNLVIFSQYVIPYWNPDL